MSEGMCPSATVGKEHALFIQRATPVAVAENKGTIRAGVKRPYGSQECTWAAVGQEYPALGTVGEKALPHLYWSHDTRLHTIARRPKPSGLQKVIHHVINAAFMQAC